MQFNPMDDYSKDPDILKKFGRNIVELVKEGKAYGVKLLLKF